MRSARAATIVKLGGSLAGAPHVKDWLTALAACGGRVVIVPGGGPFADAVRSAQAAMGFDDRAAHHMALLAMEQFAIALCALEPRLAAAASFVAIDQALRDGRAPVWLPSRIALGARDLPQSWDLTSDSLAAWLAARLGIRRVLLVKHGLRLGDPHDLDALTADGVVDPLFAHTLRAARLDGVFAGPCDHARAAAWICDPQADLPAPG